MKVLAWSFLALFAKLGLGQSDDTTLLRTENVAAQDRAATYLVIGATFRQEALLRSQIQAMRAAVLPLRVLFVPHWKYLDNARIFRLHVPTGYASAMFTHLPSRTVFVNTLFYSGDDWVGHWMAHELGHLETNSIREDHAEKAATALRARLKAATQQGNR